LCATRFKARHAGRLSSLRTLNLSAHYTTYVDRRIVCSVNFVGVPNVSSSATDRSVDQIEGQAPRGVARIGPIAGAGQEGRATSCLRWRVSRAALGGIDISASTSPRSLRPLTLAGPGGGFSLEPVHAVGPEFCLSAMKGVKCCEFTLEVAAGQNSGFGSDRSSRYASGGRSKQVGDSTRYGTRSTQTAQ
jgi:hypothetical protein